MIITSSKLTGSIADAPIFRKDDHINHHRGCHGCQQMATPKARSCDLRVYKAYPQSTQTHKLAFASLVFLTQSITNVLISHVVQNLRSLLHCRPGSH